MRAKELLTELQQRFGDTLREAHLELGQVTVEVAPEHMLETCTALRDERTFRFDQLTDIC
jgi:NADH-quinone oxidoreductase subunit C